jgi:hypothetical protein
VTSEPIADLLDLLMYAVIVPEKFIDHMDARVPGTGPYCLEEEKPGEVRLSVLKITGRHLRQSRHWFSAGSPAKLTA